MTLSTYQKNAWVDFMEKVCTLISKRFHSQWVVKVKIQQNFLTYILLNAEIQMVPCENSTKEVSY